MDQETQERVAAFVAEKLQTSADEAQIVLESGNIMLSECSNVASTARLNKSVPPGTYKVSVYYLPDDMREELEDSATMGIDSVVVHFGDGEIAGWEDVATVEGESPVDCGNLIDIVIADQEAGESAEDEIASALEDCYTEGFETCAQEAALVVYVGEVAIDHEFYWAVDGGGRPLKLVGIFKYPGE